MEWSLVSMYIISKHILICCIFSGPTYQKDIGFLTEDLDTTRIPDMITKPSLTQLQDVSTEQIISFDLETANSGIMLYITLFIDYLHYPSIKCEGQKLTLNLSLGLGISEYVRNRLIVRGSIITRRIEFRSRSCD